MTRNPGAFISRVNRPVGSLPIEHDLITLVAAHVQRTSSYLSYLEIGISVLKCFDTQVAPSPPVYVQSTHLCKCYLSHISTLPHSTSPPLPLPCRSPAAPLPLPFAPLLSPHFPSPRCR